MALVRVFLPTYRRPRLLERAIDSLCAQTMPDWICELHNDAPDDAAPGELFGRLGDSRFEYHRHERNLGGTATFNLFFHATSEPFYAMLEDDNAWESTFLEKMIGVAGQQPDATVFWCNQSIGCEEANGTVRDTGETVHPREPGQPPRRIAWGQPEQIFGALHAHGAALFRSRPGDHFATPRVPIALVEAFRERCFPYPLVYVPEPLAQFTRTRQTARSEDRGEWAVVQTMLAATFLKHARYDDAQLRALWHAARSQRPPATGTLLLATFVEPSCRPLRRHAQAADWLRLIRGLVRRPAVLNRVLSSKRRHADWWQFLDVATAARFADQRRQACLT
jgi:glycosyltransferase involved in cell wall biosynthesis